MPLSFTVKAKRTTPEEHARGNLGTGTIEFLLDGAVIARFHKLSLRYSSQQQKYYIKPPARSVDTVNPQTGQPQKQWFDQWEFFPNDRQVHDGWAQAIIREMFNQIPDIAQVPEAAPAHVGVAAQGYTPPGTYGAPAPAGPPMPPQAAPVAGPPAAAPVPGGWGAPPSAPPAPAAPPAAAPVPAAPQAPAYAPAAPGAPPMPSPGAPPFAPQPPRPPAPPAGPTAHMPPNPGFPLPG